MLVLGFEASITSTVFHKLGTLQHARTNQSTSRHFESQDDSQRMRLQGFAGRSVLWAQRELSTTHQLPCHRKSYFAGSRKPSGWRQSSHQGRDTAEVPPSLLHPRLLDVSLRE